MDETDKERHEQLNAEIIRRMNQTSLEWKAEEIENLYPAFGKPEEAMLLDSDGERRCSASSIRIVFDLDEQQQGSGYLIRPQTTLPPSLRNALSGCPNKRCDSTFRRPCRLLQYLEECVGCGVPIGDNTQPSILD
jgi:hypothetical protein